MTALRAYQNDLIGEVRGAMREGHKRICLQAATGSGKTVIGGSIAAAANAKGRRVMALVHRDELIRQFTSTLYDFGMDEVGIIAPKHDPTPWARFHVASVQSLVRRTRMKWLQPDVILVDEAHHARAASWESCLKRFPDAVYVGLTATPMRNDQKGLGEMFSKLVCGPQIGELVDMGYLAPMRVLRAPVGMSEMVDGVGKIGLDFNRGELDAKVTDKVIAASVDSYLKYTPNKKAIFFGLTTRHSELTAEAFRARGISAQHVDGGTDSSVRRTAMRRFAEGDLMVVCNVDIISEGFDAPACEVVIDGQHTLSLIRHLQKAGRAMRMSKGKKMCYFLDLAGNTHRLGLPDENRTWHLASDAPSGEAEDPKPASERLKVCKSCATVFPSHKRDCPACGSEYEAGMSVGEVNVELEDAKQPTAPRRQTSATKMKSLMKELDYLQRTKGILSDEERNERLEAIARQFGYKGAWVARQRMAQSIDL